MNQDSGHIFKVEWGGEEGGDGLIVDQKNKC